MPVNWDLVAIYAISALVLGLWLWWKLRRLPLRPEDYDDVPMEFHGATIRKTILSDLGGKQYFPPPWPFRILLAIMLAVPLAIIAWIRVRFRL